MSISQPKPVIVRGTEGAIRDLSDKPNRLAFIPEAKDLKRPLRSFPYYSHRVIYEVNDSTRVVSVLRVYHSARAPLDNSDLD